MAVALFAGPGVLGWFQPPIPVPSVRIIGLRARSGYPGCDSAWKIDPCRGVIGVQL